MSDPVSWLVIERGWTVIGSDGEEVGEVEELVGDTGKDIFNGLTVSTGLLGAAKYVPSERVAEITDERVVLDIPAAEVDRLDQHEPPPPSEQFRPD